MNLARSVVPSNTYEVPSCQEADDSLQRNLVHFCMLVTLASEVVT
jgi:hypothetical protein